MILAHSVGVITIMQVNCVALFYVRSALQPILFHVLGRESNIQCFSLLFLVFFQDKEAVEGVSVGAILSDYQRVRVEDV